MTYILWEKNFIVIKNLRQFLEEDHPQTEKGSQI